MICCLTDSEDVCPHQQTVAEASVEINQRVSMSIPTPAYLTDGAGQVIYWLAHTVE